jgi:TonB family protein
MKKSEVLVCMIVSLLLHAGVPDAQEIGSNETRKSSETIKIDGAEQPVYYVGGEVKPPQVVSAPPLHSGGPNVHGSVVVSIIVTSKGEPTNIKLISGLNAAQDALAVEAARKYKFKPSTKNGKPVSVQIAIELDFQP